MCAFTNDGMHRRVREWIVTTENVSCVSRKKRSSFRSVGAHRSDTLRQVQNFRYPRILPKSAVTSLTNTRNPFRKFTVFTFCFATLNIRDLACLPEPLLSCTPEDRYIEQTTRDWVIIKCPRFWYEGKSREKHRVYSFSLDISPSASTIRRGFIVPR